MRHRVHSYEAFVFVHLSEFKRKIDCAVHHVIKMYGGVEVKLRAHFTTVLEYKTPACPVQPVRSVLRLVVRTVNCNGRHACPNIV
jgi:hypothetical protein